ncbi:MAG: hypothetical protein ACT4PE_07825 [Candidatus Eiseniibacteriota bacterium]
MPRRIRRAVCLVVLSLASFAAATAVEPLTLDDVLRLHFAGVSEDVILSEIIVTDSVFELSVDDILRLREAGVSDRLLKFLVDTGRDGGTAELSASDPADDAYAADEEAESSEWVNEIDSEGSTTSWFVSLNYATPSWYYDLYWWDYWYYDCHYAPYRYPAWGPYSWCYNSWYPGWYSYRQCWAPAYWGYRCDWYDSSWYAHGYGSHRDETFYYSHYDRGSGGRRHDLSDVKSKGGTTSPGLPLYADAGLKVKGVSKAPTRSASLTDRPDPKVRGGRLELPGRSAISPDRSGEPVKTPAPQVRTPAGGGKPVKVRTVHAPSEPPADSPGPKETPPKTPSGTKVREVQAPQTPPASPPRVDPPKRVEPAPKSPATSGGRPAPAPKATKPADPRGSSSSRPGKPQRS